MHIKRLQNEGENMSETNSEVGELSIFSARESYSIWMGCKRELKIPEKMKQRNRTFLSGGNF